MTLTLNENYARHIAYRINTDAAEAVDLLAGEDKHAQDIGNVHDSEGINNG